MAMLGSRDASPVHSTLGCKNVCTWRMRVAVMSTADGSEHSARLQPYLHVHTCVCRPAHAAVAAWWCKPGRRMLVPWVAVHAHGGLRRNLPQWVEAAQQPICPGLPPGAKLLVGAGAAGAGAGSSSSGAAPTSGTASATVHAVGGRWWCP
jgi:hypothetical protein